MRLWMWGAKQKDKKQEGREIVRKRETCRKVPQSACQAGLSDSRDGEGRCLIMWLLKLRRESLSWRRLPENSQVQQTNSRCIFLPTGMYFSIKKVSNNCNNWVHWMLKTAQICLFGVIDAAVSRPKSIEQCWPQSIQRSSWQTFIWMKRWNPRKLEKTSNYVKINTAFMLQLTAHLTRIL